MSHKRYLALCVGSLLIICTINISAQVVNKIDQSVRLDPKKGTVMIIPCISGSLSLNGIFLTELTEGDTTYIINLNPGSYHARITNDALSIEQQLLVRAGKGTQLNVDSSNWNIQEYSDNYISVGDSLKQARYQIKKGKFYNVTQLSLLNFQEENYNDASNRELRIFNSLVTINGYQFTPGFCLGLGLMYNNYDMTFSGYNEAKIKIENVSFLPVFADIRIHLPQRGRNMAFFFKFDIGYNIVLTKRTSFSSYVDPYNGITYSYIHQVNNGGILVSPGLGFRILISDLIQIIPSIEYSFEKSKILEKNFSDGIQTLEQTYNNNFNSFKINLGIAFQY